MTIAVLLFDFFSKYDKIITTGDTNMKKKLSEEIELLLEQLPLKLENGERTITIGKFIDIISHRGFGVVLLLLSLPAALPFPAVGYAIPFGLLIILFGFQVLVGRHSPWLPYRICQKKIPPGFNVFLMKKGVPFLKRVERWSGQRMEFMTQRPFSLILGVIILLKGIIMMIPIPFTNTLPALVVFILGLGLASDDGLFVLVGLTAGVILLIVYLTIAIFSVQMFL